LGAHIVEEVKRTGDREARMLALKLEMGR